MRPLYERRKVDLMLLKEGVEFTLKRKRLNEFNEPMRGPDGNGGEYQLDVVGTFMGIYHSPNVVSSTGNYTGNHDGVSNMREKKSPLIFCRYPDVKELVPIRNDIIESDNVQYEVIIARDVNDWNIILEISLEMIDSGGVIA